MATPIRVTSTYIGALRATLGNLPIALAAAAVPALIAAPLDDWLCATLSTVPPAQEDLLKVGLAWSGVALAIELVYGPLMAALAVFVARQHAWGRKASLYKALNFALGRYKRMFLPHMGAQLSIQIGMTVIVPGVLFLMQYAFVDSVAALEDKKWAMGRSAKLTRGRRKTILWVALPFILLAMFRLFLDLAALGKGVFWLWLDYTAGYLLVFWLWVAFAQMYLKRTGQDQPPSDAAATT